MERHFAFTLRRSYYCSIFGIHFGACSTGDHGQAIFDIDTGYVYSMCIIVWIRAKRYFDLFFPASYKFVSIAPIVNCKTLHRVDRVNEFVYANAMVRNSEWQ